MTLKKILPFLSWFESYNTEALKADAISGLTVALILIPQSMAYASLAGLPTHYGLFAAFLPPLVASLFGSSRHLSTGPVAIASLITAITLEPLATAGGEAFLSYAILLSFTIGVIRLLLGVLRLGIIVNFLSHPVVNGFASAAAIIIATSQLSSIFGVSVDKEEHHYQTIFMAIKAATAYTHLPTLGFSLLAFVTMYGLKWINPKIPYIVIAILLTTTISWLTGFEHKLEIKPQNIESPLVKNLIAELNQSTDEIAKLNNVSIEIGTHIRAAEKDFTRHSIQVSNLLHEKEILNFRIEKLKRKEQDIKNKLRTYKFQLQKADDGRMLLFIHDKKTIKGEDPHRHWRIKLNGDSITRSAISLSGGGQVVGAVPSGLPSFRAPKFNLDIILQFLTAAFVITILGFVEIVTITKAIAIKSGQRLDPNQELIGQGLANIVGSFTQSYTVSGSFSRSAINFQTGAKTGMSSIFTSIVVLVTLLFLTPLLYHIPESVLASIIIMAVISLINIEGFLHIWRAQKYDGIISITSFIATLYFAPNLEMGIIIGILLSVVYYFIRNTKPRVTILSMDSNHVLRNAEALGLQKCKHLALVRFDGPLFFANTSYLEDWVINEIESMPELKHIVLVSHSINEMDASGEKMISVLIDRIRNAGLEISFSGLKDHIMEIFIRTHLYEKIGPENFFGTQAMALKSIHEKTHIDSNEKICPLLNYCPLKTKSGN